MPRTVSVLVVLNLTIGVCAIARANEAHNRLLKLTEAARRDLFQRAFQSSGESCDVVTRTFYQDSVSSGDAIWDVACKNGREYSIVIMNDAMGSMKIMDCPTLKSLNLGECWKRFKGGKWVDP